MPMNYYEGWTEKDLLALRKRVQGRQANGPVTRSSIAGVSVEKAAPSGTSQVIELKRIQYSLWLLGEAKAAEDEEYTNEYANPYTATIRRTSARYL